MTSDQRLSPEDGSLSAIIAAYLDALDGGEPPAPEELLARNPEHAAALRDFLATQDRLEALARPLRPGRAPAAVETHDPADAPTAEASGPKTVRYFGDYELRQELARGGMGVVYRARQVSLNRPVAVKMIRAGQFADERERQRFRDEAEAAANLDHPNIVPIYEVGEYDGQHYFSMKLIEGGNLGDSRGRFLDRPKDVAHVMITVARAVHHAHRRGILHRDLKPGNILIDAEGRPHVTDFGLAKRIEGGKGFTQSGAVVGTPEYMAPEQARAEKDLTTAVDVYGLGAVLYFLLTGRAPFQGDNLLETLRQVGEKEPTGPQALNPSADRDLETICLKCLHKDPARRYGSAEALADDLQLWLDGKPIRARRVTAWERAWKWANRRPAAAALLVVSVTAAVLLVGGGSVLLHQLGDALREATGKGNALAEKTTALKEQTRALVAEREALGEALARSDRDRFTLQLLRADALHRVDPNQALDLLYDNAACPIDARDTAWRFLERSCRRRLAGTKVGSALLSFPDRRQVPSADGRVCAVIRLAESGRAVVMDLASGQIQQELKGPVSGGITSDGKTACWFQPKLQSQQPVHGSSLHLQDLQTGEKRTVRIERIDRPELFQDVTWFDVSISPDGKHLAERCVSCAFVFATDTGNKVAEVLSAEKTWLGGAAFSPDGRMFAVAGTIRGRGREGVLLLEAKSGKELCFIPHSRCGLGSELRFSHDGKTLALVQKLLDPGRLEVCLFDVPGGRVRTRAELDHGRDFHQISVFRRDDRYFALAFGGGLYVWDVPAGKQVRQIRHPVINGQNLSFSADGSKVVMGSNENYDRPTVFVWDFLSGTSTHVLPVYGTLWATLREDNRLQAFAVNHPSLYPQELFCWDLDLPGPLASLKAPGPGRELNWGRGPGRDLPRYAPPRPGEPYDEHNGVFFSPDGRHVALRARKELRVFDLATGVQRLRRPDTHWYPVFLPGGKRLACLGPFTPARDDRLASRTPELWDLETGERVAWPKGLDAVEVWTDAMRGPAPGREVTVIDHKDGRRLICSLRDPFAHTLELREAATRKLINRLTGPNNVYSAFLAVSPDLQTLVEFRPSDSALLLRDLPTGQVRAVLSPYGGEFTGAGAKFNDDGTLLATWDEKGDVRVWDLRPPLEYARFPGMRFAFSPDSSKLVVTDNWQHGDIHPLVRLVDLATGRALLTAHDEKDFLANLERFPVLPPLFPSRENQRGEITSWLLFTPDRKTRVRMEPTRITVSDVSGTKVTARLPVDPPALTWPFRFLRTPGELNSIALSPDGRWLAFRSAPDEVKVASLTGKGCTTIKSQGRLAFSPDSRILAHETNQGDRYFDLATGKLLEPPVNEPWAPGAFGKVEASLPARPWATHFRAVSPDGRFLGVAYGRYTFQNEVVLWDLSRLRPKSGGAR